jgi:hypothetical protein
MWALLVRGVSGRRLRVRVVAAGTLTVGLFAVVWWLAARRPYGYCGGV